MLMNIETWLKRAKKQIAPLDAELIAMRSFAPRRTDRSWLVTHAEQIIADSQLERAEKMLQSRRQGMPMAYILGEKEFYGRNFRVQPGVLVPRPETETLINLVKELKLSKQPSFLEIGTGSGCIAITLALEYPQSYVLATDLSERALEVAEYNDIALEGRVELVKSNLLRELDFRKNPEHFDVIVANLPYVNKEWDWLDLKSLNYEPASALYAKSNNGLSMYQRFLRELNYYRGVGDGLWMDYLVLEADPCQHASLIKMAEKAGFFYLKTEGFGLLFEDVWRYYWDWRSEKYVRKSEDVLKTERKTGFVSFSVE